ncbi:MAG: hypothetical protein KDB93_10280 [Flavobacteriales bacterium]|nr:hypothetical protein [Flavobacteriales bacterium]
MKYFALLMSVLYLVVGTLLLVSPGFLPQVTRFRLPLGIILLAYGLVRGAMWRRKQAQSRNQVD